MKQLFFAAAVLLAIASHSLSQTAQTRTEPLKAGATAPDFTLKDAEGKPVTLSSVKRPTVLVFYRGYW